MGEGAPSTLSRPYGMTRIEGTLKRRTPLCIGEWECPTEWRREGPRSRLLIQGDPAASIGFASHIHPDRSRPSTVLRFSLRFVRKADECTFGTPFRTNEVVPGRIVVTRRPPREPSRGFIETTCPARFLFFVYTKESRSYSVIRCVLVAHIAGPRNGALTGCASEKGIGIEGKGVCGVTDSCGTCRIPRVLKHFSGRPLSHLC